MTQSSTFTLAGEDDVELFVYHWLPEGRCRAVVQIVHGMSEHAGRYPRLAQALTSSGYAVYAHDQRGHGRTAKSAEQLGIFAERNGWRKCLGDLLVVQRRIQSDLPGAPIILLGHSMGSTLAEQFMSEHGDSLTGAVLSGPNGQPPALAAIGRGVARLERMRLGARGRSSILAALTFGSFNKKFSPVRTAFDWLSRDTAEVDLYVNDPLSGFSARTQLWIDLLDAWTGISRPESRARIPKNLPIYVIAGGRDPVGNNTRQVEPMLAAYRAAGLERLEHRFYDDARHELFNETNRDEVTADLISWLNRITP